MLHSRMMASLLLAAALLLHPAFADARGCSVQVRDGWIRLLPNGMPMQAGFGAIANGCPRPAQVVGVASPLHGMVSLHETTVVDGVSRMREVPVLNIPAHGVVTLQPGGLHLMLMAQQRPLRVGERVILRLLLRDGRVVRAPFEVRALVP